MSAKQTHILTPDHKISLTRAAPCGPAAAHRVLGAGLAEAAAVGVCAAQRVRTRQSHDLLDSATTGAVSSAPSRAEGAGAAPEGASFFHLGERSSLDEAYCRFGPTLLTALCFGPVADLSRVT